MPNDLSALPTGRSVRHFRIERVLAANQYSHLVYLALDSRLNCHVAIRELFPGALVVRDADGCTVMPNDGEADKFAAMRQDFLEDATAQARSGHPALLSTYDAFEENGTAYVVTNFVLGEDFEQYLRRNEPLCEEELRDFALPLLEGLDALHLEGFLHLDVAPGHICIESRAGRCNPILMGDAPTRIVPANRTEPPYICVNSGYSPFEQYMANGQKGPWTDVYSLGAVLFRAVTGAPPAASPDRLEADTVPRLAENPPPGYSREFLATIDKALRMRPQERWLTCRQWLDVLAPRQTAPAVRQPWYRRLLAV